MPGVREENMISIASPDIGADEKKAVLEVMDSGMLAEGPRVREFEAAYAKYAGTKHAIAVSSGTAALHVALLAHGIGPGDEVLTTPFTFIASANSIHYTGAKPVFCDILGESFNIDPGKVREKITDKTRALMPVHLFGQPADMKALMDLAEEHDLIVVEDACQAHGAKHGNKMAGSFGTGCFSFYPTKNMTTGEGGMITTDDEEAAARARALRQHGMVRRYYHDLLGYNLRMTDMAAAIGLVQLKKLDEYNRRRRENARMLGELISNPKIDKPTASPNAFHVFHQYTIRCDKRDAAAKRLMDDGIGCGIYYPLPIHRQPYYTGLGYDESHPVSEKAASEVLSLPVHPKVSADDIGFIAGKVNSL
jgi:perosamine synthetase